MDALRQVTPDVMRCLARHPGRSVLAEFTLESSGRVADARVLPRSTATASAGEPETDVRLDDGTRDCVVGALFTIRVESFGRPSIVLRYAFSAPRE